MSAPEDDFFIGWADRLPPAHRGLIARLAGGFLVAMVLLALALAGGMDDAGAGGGDWAAGEQTFRGIVTARPYALLHVAPDAAHPAGHVMMLAEVGKYPVPVPPEWEGRGLEVKGWKVRRGALEMVQMTAAPVPQDLPAAAQPVEKLGRWRITGEICDGQCYAGLMRPGTGLAHRACADFCIEAGVPPVFVATAPVAGSAFLLMAAPDGGPVGPAMYAYVGLRVRLDGEVERRGDMLVFRPDFTTAMLP